MRKTNHKVSLSGSYASGSTENLFKKLTHDGILQLSLIGREITLQVRSDDLEEIKEILDKAGVDNLSILDWSKCGTTLSGSGAGSDDSETIKVSLIPSALDEGVRCLAILSEFKFGDRTMRKMENTMKSILTDAGVTDALYTIRILKEASEQDYVKCIKIAAVNALFEAGGVVNIE